MPDFIQDGLITTLHDLGTTDRETLEAELERAAGEYPIGLVLPVTADDMRAEPFGRIIEELSGARFISKIVVVLGLAPEAEEYRETKRIARRLEGKADVLWTDGVRIQELYGKLKDAGLDLGVPGKGRAVWTAFLSRVPTHDTG